MMEIDIPELTELNDYRGDFPAYIKAIYEIFKKDFVDAPPFFRDQRLGIKRHPEIDGREYTFYHMTHKGLDEQNRTPDLRRCERISWAKPTIEKCDTWELKVWEQKRGGETRICIWLELDDEPDYFVVLNKRKGYLLPWTAFVIEYEHERATKEKDYQRWLNKAGGA